MAPSIDRLSLVDRFFLAAERPNAPMHIGATLVFEAGGWRGTRGRVDVRALRQHVTSRLHRIPRFRQKLAYTPLEGRPFWTDDAQLDLSRHVRHLCLQGPGGDSALKRVAGEILSLPLDPGRPLWELWVVDGLYRDRFAVITKMHHAMADGIGGVEQLVSLLDAGPGEAAETPPSWTPRPAPPELELLTDELRSLASGAAANVAAFGRSLARPGSTWASAASLAGAVGEVISASLQPTLPTPLNRPLGPDRRVEWLAVSFSDLRAIKRRFGGTINDVVLAAVTGGLRRYLRARGVPFDRGEIRAAVPVNVREAASGSGNHVSFWLVPLPVGEGDAETRFHLVRESTAARKEGGSAHALHAMLGWMDGLSPALLTGAVRVLERSLPFHVIVTNVPGSPFPLYLRGSKMLAAYPSVPLFERQGLGVALLSYDGMLHWGFQADPEQVPDLEALAYAVAASLAELLEHATVLSGFESPDSAATPADEALHHAGAP